MPGGTLPQPDHQMLLQSASFSIAGGVADRLLRDYNDRLVSDLGMMSRREVKKKDIVDLRPLFDLRHIPDWQAPDPKLDFQDKMYIATDYYYCCIPCFEEGVYHVNAGRYIYWRVKDMDLANHRMMLWLQDFVYYSEGCGWQPGVHGTVAWKFGDPGDEMRTSLLAGKPMQCGYASLPDAVTDYVQMYGLLDVKKLGWSKKDIESWHDLVISNAKKGCELMHKKTGSHNLDSLAAIFTSYTIKTNRILSEHKAASKSEPASKSEHQEYLEAKREEKAMAKKPNKPVQERRIRTIGNIRITSRSKPKPGRRAVANYTKAAWTTRGHLRTLKSGKKVYVRESVHRRKALLDAETASQEPVKTPLTIRLEKPKEKPEGSDQQNAGTDS